MAREGLVSESFDDDQLIALCSKEDMKAEIKKSDSVGLFCTAQKEAFGNINEEPESDHQMAASVD